MASPEFPLIVWPQFTCDYTDTHGMKCTCVASKRIHFSASHPFDHMNLCETHLAEFKIWVWCEILVDGRVN
jgi:hypothetical protein